MRRTKGERETWGSEEDDASGGSRGDGVIESGMLSRMSRRLDAHCLNTVTRYLISAHKARRVGCLILRLPLQLPDIQRVE
jgi:hypothetical protein